MELSRRTTLLVLGYFKLVLMNIPDLVGVLHLQYIVIQSFLYEEFGPSWVTLVRSAVALALVTIDTCFCVLLLRGGHKRNRSLLRMYSWCGIVGVVCIALLTAGVIAGNVSMMIDSPDLRDDILSDYTVYLIILWYGLANIAIEISLLVLVRRELRTLKNDREDTELKDIGPRGP